MAKRGALVFASVAILILAASFASAYLINLNSNVGAYYKFNKNIAFGENSSFLYDLSGNGNNAQIFGANWYRGGVLSDGALKFDGINDYILTKDNDKLSPSNKGITISIWIKPNTGKFAGTDRGYVNFLGKSDYSSSANSVEYKFRIYNSSNSEKRPNRISFYVFNKDGGIGIGSYFQDNISFGREWIHVVGVYNGTNTFIYKNGILRDSDSTKGIVVSNTNSPLYIGNDGQKGSFFNGSVDEFTIFNRVLNSSEIKALYLQKTLK